MRGHNGTVLTYNGEIYNYVELREELAGSWAFQSKSDTEVILAAYDKWGRDCVNHLRGMFAFALWDERRKRLFAARDRFAIKPFHYAVVDGVIYFASEIKALLPMLPDVATDPDALAEYLTFQYTIGETTLFKDAHAAARTYAYRGERRASRCPATGTYTTRWTGSTRRAGLVLRCTAA
jgi:asparagine synthase (glutamine-hydrolysing)